MQTVNREILTDMIIGIDPGISNGSISYLKPNEIVKSVKMPRTFSEISEYLKYLKSISEHPLCFVEKVQMMFDDSSEQNRGKQFNIKKMLDHYAEIKAALVSNQIPFCQVHPMSWQKYLQLRMKRDEPKTIRKNRYKDAAKSYYPEINVTLGNADSLLLIEFGRRKKQFDPEWIISNLPQNIHPKIF